MFDNSDYPESSPYYCNVNKKIIGKFKYKACGILITEFIGLINNNKTRSHTQLDSRKQVIAFQDGSDDYKHKGSSTPTKTRKTSNRQIQYNVENFDKIHASSASVRNWSSQ